ncbi:hypothetical protein OOK58_43145 [Streptomyces sp. NBC_01728]|uniref:hypothetical protein n=1 Tax=unclassified Streptomyces TaxID=2593676 RepID=UPI00224E6E5A|nr:MULTISPECIES: hypothetical protein [unclassified Streptomyces]MCX4458710.1 hypothetical protein [Streptomyces sp. NBC_01719]MCX4498067.1 hypothetical protein [Streptomyces sp. NBC_01728]
MAPPAAALPRPVSVTINMRRIVQVSGTLPVPVLVAPMGDEEFTIITDIDELAHRGRVTEPEPWFATPGGEVQPRLCARMADGRGRCRVRLTTGEPGERQLSGNLAAGVGS